MGKPITTANRQGYRAVAAAVLASAVRDLRTPTMTDRGDSTAHPTSFHQKTARQFFRSPPSPRLTLWCTWLDLAPDQVCNVLATTDE